MKLITTIATVALLWAGAVKANDFGAKIEQAYVAAGFSNVVVEHRHGDWLVHGDLAGVTQTFRVDHRTGASTAVDPNTVTVGDDGAANDVGDDNGVDGAGHDVGDDNGDDGAGHDAGDDHGGGNGDGGGDSGGSDD